MYDAAVGRWFTPDPLAPIYHDYSPYSYALNNPLKYIDPNGQNVYYVNEKGEVILAKKEDGDHRFINHEGKELEALGEDANYVGGALANASDEIWESLGDSDNAKSLKKVAGLYNSQQMKNAFLDNVDLITGLGGLVGLAKRGWKWFAKKFGDDAAEKVSKEVIEKMAKESIEMSVEIVARDGDVVIIRGKHAKGTVEVIADMVKKDQTLILNKAHIDGPGPGSMGVQTLKDLGKEFGKQQGVKQVIINPGKRTTGAMKGKTPSPIVIDIN